jgi:acyl-CoA hydrolase
MTNNPLFATASDIDLSAFIRPGDHVWVGQGCAEPLSLSSALVRQRAELGPCTVQVGIQVAGTFRVGQCAPLSLRGYGGITGNEPLVASGDMDIVVSHYSHFPRLLDTGVFKCDVALVQLSAEGPDGMPSFGIAHDYMLSAMRKARVVLVEVNDRMPWTYGSQALQGVPYAVAVRTSRPLVEMPRAAPGQLENIIAANVARFVDDRATLEVGFGSLADAVLSGIRDRRDLGFHSGLMGDAAIDLMRSGVITNAFKTIFPGKSTAGLLFGSRDAMEFAHRRHDLHLCDPSTTHDICTIAQIDGFVAVNSAIEVDLWGQVNAEVLNGRYIGAVGGQVDFVRGAAQSRGGRSIIALPSTDRGGTISRIVPHLAAATVTTPRSDADTFVTEWGAAQLRGQPLAERRRRMIAIAHPDQREALERATHAAGRD